MKTHTFTMAVLAAGVALALSAQVQGQVVLFPKVVASPTGFVCTSPAVGVDIGSTSGNKGTVVTDNVVLNILLTGRLASAITATDATIPLVSATGFAFPGTVKIDSELITYTGITGNSLTGATRGAIMTTAAAHLPSAEVDLQVLGTQNDITFNSGSGADVISVPEASACSLDSKSCGNPTTACAAQTCGTDGTCNLDGLPCTTSANCAAQTCAKTGAPDCAVNPTILKEATTFGYEPASCCSTGACPGTCTGLRALVFSMKSAGTKAPIGNGKALYTCKIAIAASAADGSYPLTNSLQVASDQSGNSICAGGLNGAVVVPMAASPTPTGTPTGSPTATFTPGTPGTPKATNTATVSPTPSKKPTTPGGGGGGNDDDSCSIVSPANGHAGWMLLLPAAALLWIRRRSR